MLSTAKVHVSLQGSVEWTVDDDARYLSFPHGLTPVEIVAGHQFAMIRSDNDDVYITTTLPKLFGTEMVQHDSIYLYMVNIFFFF